MVRTTRTSAAVKNSTSGGGGGGNSSGDSDSTKGEASPPRNVETAFVGDAEGLATVAAVEELNLSTTMKASVVLEKLQMEQINPGTSADLGTVRKSGRGTRKSVGQPRATRRQQRTHPTLEQKEDSNDDGLVELIEIVDEDSKSHEGSNMTPSEVSESTVMAVDEELEESKMDVKMEIDKDTQEQTVQNDKKSDEDEASSTGSGSAPSVQPETEGESGLKTELVGTRKSKRQVKVTNKYRDFVVDAPLPSSQVSYADVKLARSSSSGRKSQPTKEPEVPLPASLDEVSPPESPPPMLHPPVRTYGSKKKSDDDTPRI